MQGLPHVYFLMFINSVSGGGVGRQYLTIRNRKVKLKSSQSLTTIYLYDLFQEEDRKKGLKKAQELTIQKNEINIVICGGDGTIIWVIEQAIKFGVDPDKIFFTVIPIGTGNDFSRSLNWGGSPIRFQEGKTQQLKERVKRWKKAQRKKFDLWDIEMITEEGGKILFPKEEEKTEKRKIFKRTFCNYVGVGIDARVSYGFEQKRVRNKLLNFAIYGCLGFCNLFKKTQKVNDVVEQLSESGSQMQSEAEDLDMSIRSDRRNVSLLKEDSKVQKKYRIRRKQKGLVCLNCTSYMAGVKNVWRTKKSRNQQAEQLEQAFDDGKLEFVSFRNQLTLGLSRFIDVCSKVGQGEGPFIIQFKKSEQKLKKIFVHVDGQAMVTYGLKYISIRKTNLVEGSRINILVNNFD